MRYLLSTLLFLISLSLVPAVVLANTEPAPIVIGAIYNTSGEQSALDTPSAQGAQLAVHEINQAGGVLGRPLQLELVNGNSQPSIIQQQAKVFAHNPAISVVIGLSDTNMVLAAAPELAQMHKLFITSGATSPNLATQVPDYLFLSCFTDSQQAKALADFAVNRLRSESAYVLADASMSYSILLSQYFQQDYKKAGGQIIGVHTFKQGMPIDRQIDSIKLASHAPDVIFLAASPGEAPALIKQIRQAGLQQPILSGDSFDSGDLIKTLGKHADNIYFTTHALISNNNPDRNVQQFIRKYRAYYHQAPANSFAALGYDTVKLLAAAMLKTRSTDPSELRQALLSLQNWPGVTGNISYNNNAIPDKKVVLIKIHNGHKSLAV